MVLVGSSFRSILRFSFLNFAETAGLRFIFFVGSATDRAD